jgi:diguanylate cyclase (GGDEF)-like protein/PAS domain S-box-containing protein
LLRKHRRDSAVVDRDPDVRKLLHELQVHQIELELRNAELVQARDEVDIALRRYTELYDFAPVAYLTLDDDFIIRQINLTGATLLGAERSRLIGRPFSQFVAPDDRPGFADFAARVRASGARENGELALFPPDGPHAQRHLHIEAVASGGGGFWVVLLDITEQRQLKETIWRQANYDPLTLLPNRHLFIDRLRHELEMTQRAGAGHLLALLFIDLDRFKEVNDTLGHDTGDQLLVEAARRIAGCVRATDTAARLGGDEFTVILSMLPDGDRVGAVARDICDALARAFTIGDAVLHVSASIGITLYPLDAQDLRGLLGNADRAMYAAKSAGRSRFSYFTPSLQLAAQARLDMIRDLRVALTGGQFEVYFQPIVDLATGQVVSAEALLRWRHPQRGIVAPGEFIAVVEDVGLAGALGDWVFAETSRWARQWRDESGHEISVSINVSPKQLAIPGSAARWGVIVDELALARSQISIDITEGLLLDGSPTVVEELRGVRKAGFAVALDGFGTGRSALSSLTDFDIGVVKIDGSLVPNLATDPNARGLVEAIIVMARKLRIRVVAEGVETVEQRDMLRAAGCDFGQGFLFAPPLPPESAWARWATIRI